MVSKVTVLNCFHVSVACSPRLHVAKTGP